MKMLIVLTSNDALGETGKKTGFWAEELAVPYYQFEEAGLRMTLASPKGGRPPQDPRSQATPAGPEVVRRFAADPRAQAVLDDTVALRDVLAEDFEAVFFPGGHGPLWDLAEDPVCVGLVEEMLRSGKPSAFVCHAPGILKNARNSDGEPIVKDRDVTGFSNSEEEALGLTNVVPFLVETMLRENGGRYTKGEDGAPHVVVDGMLITGQNSASSEPAAKAVLKRLNFFSAPSFVASIPWNAS
jgi:putative intracellular protease/amidase